MGLTRRSVAVDPAVKRVVKFLPTSPPRRGEVILVDGERCRVTRAKVRWREPGVWELRTLRVKPLGPAGDASEAGRLRGRGWPLGNA